MATRSIIKINYGDTKLTLYRHHDGYLAVGGYDLACFLQTYPRASKLIKAMINRQRGIYIHDMETSLYSIESCSNIGEEYTYIINFETETQIKIEVLSYNEVIFLEYGNSEEVIKAFYKLCNDEQYRARNYQEVINQ
tara:strand:+ start:24648 stop:25058 length:411 start_codon:yes stop_codon:yes gene_type:complete